MLGRVCAIQAIEMNAQMIAMVNRFTLFMCLLLCSSKGWQVHASRPDDFQLVRTTDIPGGLGIVIGPYQIELRPSFKMRLSYHRALIVPKKLKLEYYLFPLLREFYGVVCTAYRQRARACNRLLKDVQRRPRN